MSWMKGAVEMFEKRAQRAFDAMNRRDLAAIVALWSDDAVFEFPGQTPISGRIEGKAAIEAWWRRWIGRYANVQFTVKHVGVASMRPRHQVLLVAWDVEVTTTDGIRGQASGITLTKQRGGRIAYARDYFFDPTVLERFWGRVEPAGTAPPTPRPAPVVAGA